MIKFDEAYEAVSIDIHDDGITLVSSGFKVFMTWAVIDKIADATEEHYLSGAIRELAIMASQKTVN